jgi:hypothetical protein
MPDNPPLSTTVPESVTIDTGADQAELGNLNKAFDDFWGEQDKGAGTATDAPPAPGEGAAQETVKESKPPEPKAEPKPESKPPAESKAPEPIPITDEDIDKMQLGPETARPQYQEQFKNLKAMWKADRARLQAEAEKAKQLEAQLSEARTNQLTPEIKADYEHAAQVRRRFDFVSDPEFIRRYHVPVRQQFEQILDEVVPMLAADRQTAQNWAQEVKANYQPDGLSREWWVQSVVNKVPNELDRSTLLNSISKLIGLQKERDTEISRRTADKSSFDNWINEKTQYTQQRVQQEIMAEIGEQEKYIQEVLPRDVSAAKTADERKAIEAHNERFTKLNAFFQDMMKDISANGPRAWVRASVQATRAKLLETENKELQSDYKGVKAERDRLKAELDKINGARRKITHTTGTPPTSGLDSSKRNGQGLTIKDLADPRKAFDQYWGEVDRNQ